MNFTILLSSVFLVVTQATSLSDAKLRSPTERKIRQILNGASIHDFPDVDWSARCADAFSGHPLAQIAAMTNKPRILRELHAHGIDIDQPYCHRWRGEEMDTPLMTAAITIQPDAFRALVELGANWKVGRADGERAFTRQKPSQSFHTHWYDYILGRYLHLEHPQHGPWTPPADTEERTLYQQIQDYLQQIASLAPEPSADDDSDDDDIRTLGAVCNRSRKQLADQLAHMLETLEIPIQKENERGATEQVDLERVLDAVLALNGPIAAGMLGDPSASHRVRVPNRLASEFSSPGWQHWEFEEP